MPRQHRNPDLSSEESVNPSELDAGETIALEATVITGFESQAIEECREVCEPITLFAGKGRIFFYIAKNNFHKALILRSIDNLFLIGYTVKDLNFENDKEKDLKILNSLIDKVNWHNLIPVWAELMKFEGILFPERKAPEKTELNEPEADKTEKEETGNVEENVEKLQLSSADDNASANVEAVESVVETQDNKDETPVDNYEKNVYKRRPQKGGSWWQKKNIPKPIAKPPPKPYIDDGILKFRATCIRNGKHSFSSMEAAASFGGELQDRFNWTVDLTRFDINVTLTVEDRNAHVSLGLTKQSLHRRNISHFGPTTMRATMCYHMVRLAKPDVGEIILDPLCGGGSISIEGALSFPNTFHLCGDKNHKAIGRTTSNLKSLKKNNQNVKVDATNWDSTKIPLKDQCVDILVTDLPFGKRSGDRRENLKLYKKILDEIARVIVINKGRAVLLTNDKKSIIWAAQGSEYWKIAQKLAVNQGGLNSQVILLYRNSVLTTKV